MQAGIVIAELNCCAVCGLLMSVKGAYFNEAEPLCFDCFLWQVRAEHGRLMAYLVWMHYETKKNK
jgi:hypothetical protein